MPWFQSRKRKKEEETITAKTSMAFTEHEKKPAKTGALWITETQVSSEMTRKNACLSIVPIIAATSRGKGGAETQRRQLTSVLSTILPARPCDTRAQQALGCGSRQGRPEAWLTLKGVKQGAIQLDRGHWGQVAIVENNYQTRNLPTSARLSPGLGTAGGSRSRDSAWILRKRSLRSVFCARAWNMLKNSRALLVKGRFRKNAAGD